MKGRKFLKKALCLALSCAVVFTAVGCGGGLGQAVTGDETKVNLLVWNYNGGVGESWLDKTAARFEKAKENEVYGDLKGVDILINHAKTDIIQNIAMSDYSVFFLQNVNYNQLQASNTLLNISDIVTSKLPNEDKSIEDKMSPQTSQALKALDGNYYVVPHYQSYDGITYNKSMFDEKNFYFAANASDYATSVTTDPAYGFIKNANAKKTCGPDGVFDTNDDGLPSSIEEFERLCKYIDSKGINSFIWYNGFNQSYQMKLNNSVWAALEGYTGAMATYNFTTGSETTKIVTGFNGDEPQSTEKTISKDNAWEVYQQESRFYTLKLCEFVFGNNRNYASTYSYGDASHTEVQRRFLQGEAAMILEGTYWENEANDARTFATYPELLDVETRIMPLPVQAKGSVTEGKGKAPVMIDTLSSYAFVNANTKTKHNETVEALAKEFLQFCNTDISPAEFTAESSVTKDLTYDISTEQYNALSSFAKSVWDAKRIGKVVTPISGEIEFIKNDDFHMTDSKIWMTSGENKIPYVQFDNVGKMTAKEYFLGMKDARGQTWWNALSR